MTKVGGWNLVEMEPCKLPQEVATGFTEAMDGMAGASYVPVLYCGTQVVNGTNHLLICRQTMVTAEPIEGLAEVILHQPLHDDKWTILHIKNIL